MKRVAVVAVALTVAAAGCKPKPTGGEAPASSAVASGIPVAPMPAPTPPPPVVQPGAALASFSPLVKQCDPAVVTVFANKTGRGGRMLMQGLGTGFVYDASGFILTNNHVIEIANEITVRLADERRVPAKLVGRDIYTDIAVLKVEAGTLPSLPLGDSDGLEVGDWVFAIGNPFGLSHTVSAGILSAKGRTQENLEGLDKTGRGYFNFLQTDAAINQGNSGGPLLNLSGQVVGINTAIRANANSIGFAIPINMVKSLLPMIVKDGKVTRSAMGVGVAVVAEGDVARLKRPDRKGALITKVTPGGPADKAGLAADDVVIAFNGRAVADPNELRWLASIAGVGQTAVVKVARGDRTFDVKVVLGELPAQPEDAEPPGGELPPGFPLRSVWLGVCCKPRRERNVAPHVDMTVRPALRLVNDPPSGTVRAVRRAPEVNSAERATSNKEARLREAEEDRELIEAARRGENAAFRTLVEKHQRRAFAIALAHVRDEHDAHEIVQEAFLRVYRGIPSFNGGSTFFTWLYRIVTNLAIDLKRKPGPKLDAGAADLDDLDESQGFLLARIDGGGPFEVLHRGEVAARIHEALAALPPYHRGVILLREVEGMSYDEMAEAMGVSKGTIMSRLFHARQKLQRALATTYREATGREPARADEDEP